MDLSLFDTPRLDIDQATAAGNWAQLLALACGLPDPVPPVLAPLVARAWAEVPLSVQVGSGHTDRVSALLPLPDSRTALSAGMDGRLLLWDLAGAGLRQTLTGPGVPLVHASLRQDGRQILTASLAGVIRLWDRASGRQTTVMGGAWRDEWLQDALTLGDDPGPIGRRSPRKLLHVALLLGLAAKRYRDADPSIAVLAAAPDGRHAVTTSLDPGPQGTVLRLWDLERGRPARELRLGDRTVTALAWPPEGRYVVVGEGAGPITVWDPDNGRLVNTLAGHPDGTSALAVVPGGRRILSGGADGTVRLWDLATSTLVQTFTGTETPITALAAAPDGGHALVGGKDGQIGLWALAPGTLLRRLPGHTGAVDAIAVTRDGRIILSGGADHTVRFWALPGPLLA